MNKKLFPYIFSSKSFKRSAFILHQGDAEEREESAQQITLNKQENIYFVEEKFESKRSTLIRVQYFQPFFLCSQGDTEGREEYFLYIFYE